MKKFGPLVVMTFLWLLAVSLLVEEKSEEPETTKERQEVSKTSFTSEK